ncbi:hypothetical protein [Bacillus sp. REN10]|uniref:hypothetical protein n=1 Tax=Bacillus sp. REN10 TaxID=2782541 RepID=UPI00193C262A|nr:hypothetical protein [Bacillus sp. REN10]
MSVDFSNPSNKAAFQAYSQLTLVSRFKQHLETGSDFGDQTIEEIESQMGLSEFMDTIKSDKVVNPDLSREVSDFHNGILQDRMRLSGDVAYAGQVSSIINKAFKLGLVGNDQELIKKYK